VETRCNGSVPGRNRTRNRTGNLDPLLTLVAAIVVPAHLVREIAAAGGIDSVWLLYHHVDLDTYWTVY